MSSGINIFPNKPKPGRGTGYKIMLQQWGLYDIIFKDDLKILPIFAVKKANATLSCAISNCELVEFKHILQYHICNTVGSFSEIYHPLRGNNHVKLL